MRLAHILLHRVQYIPGVTGTTVRSVAHTIQTGLIAMWNALGARAIQFETFGARANIGSHATSLLAATEKQIHIYIYISVDFPYYYVRVYLRNFRSINFSLFVIYLRLFSSKILTVCIKAHKGHPLSSNPCRTCTSPAQNSVHSRNCRISAHTHHQRSNGIRQSNRTCWAPHICHTRRACRIVAHNISGWPGPVCSQSYICIDFAHRTHHCRSRWGRWRCICPRDYVHYQVYRHRCWALCKCHWGSRRGRLDRSVSRHVGCVHSPHSIFGFCSYPRWCRYQLVLQFYHVRVLRF